MIEYDNALLRITGVQGKKEFLVIMADKNIHQGVLHLESKKQLRQLSKIL